MNFVLGPVEVWSPKPTVLGANRTIAIVYLAAAFWCQSIWQGDRVLDVAAVTICLVGLALGFGHRSYQISYRRFEVK